MKTQQTTYYTQQQQHEQDVIMKEALRKRKFHLPGNETWWEDWRQYVGNNHPLLALIGCGYNYNNNKTKQQQGSSNNQDDNEETLADIRKRRFLVLLSSLCCGITLSIGSYLWSTTNKSLSEIMLQFIISTYPYDNEQKEHNDEAVTIDFARYQIYLWTWMSILHVVHDLMIWYSCCCFLSSSLSLLRGYILWTICWIVAVTSLLISVSVSEATNTNTTNTNDQDAEDGIMDETETVNEENNNNNNIVGKLLINIVMELVLAWVVWFPIVATTLFSGILGCFRVPILGGRRQELYSLRQKERRQEGKEYPVTTMKALAEYDATTMLRQDV